MLTVCSMSKAKPDDGTSTGRIASASLCVRLRAARESRGLSLMQLARISGVSPAAVSYLERGEKLPRTDTVERLARALQVSRCWLAFGDGQKPDFARSKADCEKCGGTGERSGKE